MEDDNIIFEDIDADLHHFDEYYPGMNNVRRKQYYDIETFNLLSTDLSDLKILHLNIRSLKSNDDYFSAFLSELKCNFDVICLTESWLTEDTKQLYNFPGFTAYHSLRSNNQAGGGVTVLVSGSYCVKLLTEHTVCTRQIESLFLELTHRKSKQMLILGTVYKPPDSDTILFTNVLCRYLSQVIGGSKSDCILCGDFNIDLLKIETHAPTLEFLTRLNSNSFMPTISKPTRVTDTSATLIDNIFISTPALYTSGIFTNDISDHFPIFIIINNYFQQPDSLLPGNRTIKYRSINDNTIAVMREMLMNHDFDAYHANEDCSNAFMCLDKFIYDSFNASCPIKIKTISLK